MKLTIGTEAPEFNIVDIYGKKISLESMKGKRFMLSFYRYASCPFCNLRISFLMGLHDELKLENQFIGIFQSTEEDMSKHVTNQNTNFSICSDFKRVYYKKYGVDTSIFAYIKGALKINTLLKASKKGFKIKNSMGPKTTVPADFLIDENGIIKNAFYGKDISDHLDIDIVADFFK